MKFLLSTKYVLKLLRLFPLFRRGFRITASPIRRMTEMLTKHTSNRPRRDHANSNGRLASGTGNYLLQRCATEAVGGRGAEAVEAPGHIHHRRCSSSGGFIKDCLTSPQQIDSNTCSPVLGHKNHSRLVFIVSVLLFSNKIPSFLRSKEQHYAESKLYFGTN